ncbi:hypothetical protein VOLCADRAFT_120146 [Volvox carteri f. nagariensis]|uniref:N-acetyltransferase domain-containing protein n=1 Tax=Volvox carteri f. nagariensis TaxID=3068 RepID=D8TH66_VOLCA|nr:uncharacterized protein VOLCADRAFT_120146 [Volvox carteri f. nagariensis]EFJ52658.1 hypothetical protein VOLCADRAFT_120146 [Volvox carteri f. nagariensis]|eukprot:XP_002945663.1 hypothetical protein VOLCADRAFT_120146 [Volvox carteri f. nagariensis]
MSQLKEIQEFLAGPQGPMAVAALVFALGLIVIAKYLLRAGGVGTSKRAAAKRKQPQPVSVSSGVPAKAVPSAAKGTAPAEDDEDGSDNKGMGSIVGGCSTDLKCRPSSRSSSHATPWPVRATTYALDSQAHQRNTSEIPVRQAYGRTSPSTASRPTAWCSATVPSQACWFNPPLDTACCRHDAVSIAPTSASSQPRWGGVITAAAKAARRDGRHRARRILPLPAAAPASAAAAAADPNAEVSYTSNNGLVLMVRKIRTLDELRQVATLRADAYYAENQSRFVGSLKKKFVEQEVESLQQRTTILSRQGKPYSECLVAIDSASGAVLACIDMRLPAALNGTHPHGVPQDDPSGCYLLNVVVREDVRGQGLGRGIMQAAMVRAVQLWGAGALYTHVEADNEVAYKLYHSCGFERHSADSKYEAASKLGQTVSFTFEHHMALTNETNAIADTTVLQLNCRGS